MLLGNHSEWQAMLSELHSCNPYFLRPFLDTVIYVHMYFTEHAGLFSIFSLLDDFHSWWFFFSKAAGGISGPCPCLSV